MTVLGLNMHRLILALVPAAVLLGCRTPDFLKAPIPDVAPVREGRRQEVLRDFDARRDKTQYAAAISRWQQGDLAGCRESLDSLLNRNPNHADGLKLKRQLDQAAELEDEESPDDEVAAEIADGDAKAAIPTPPVKKLDSPPADVHAAVWFGPAEPGKPVGQIGTVVDVLDVPLSQGLAASQIETTEPLAGTDKAKYPESAVPSRTADDKSRVAAKAESGHSDWVAVHTRSSGAEEARQLRADRRRYDGGAHTSEARAHIQEAVRALSAGDADSAATLYRAAMAEESGNPEIPVAAAVMALRYEQPELALELAQSAASRFPDNAAACRTLGTVRYHRGDYEAAKSALGRSISLDKASALSYFLMGHTLRKLGENEAAGWNFQQARRLDPKYTLTK